MRNGVNEHDRVILVCSETSLSRKGLRNEIEETLAREARDGGATYLMPVTLDDFIFDWSDVLAQPIRDRVVADFRHWREPEHFTEGVVKLLKALRV